jgi:hypothetical protein
MALSVPSWIAAIATVVLALGATITAVFAIRASGKQNGGTRRAPAGARRSGRRCVSFGAAEQQYGVMPL